MTKETVRPLRRFRSLTPWLLAAAVLLLVWPAAAQTQCPSVVWSDEFDGTAVDTSKWSFQTGDGCAEGVCGWGNNELQTYQVDNASVSSGTLKIEAREERVKNKNYTSARIRTLNQGDFYFGRFEARIKLTVGQGIWPAFWMMPTDEVYGGWPQSGEIDIMENIGSEPSTVHGTIHFGDPWPDNSSTGASYKLLGGERFTDAFHEFAIEKEAGVIRWFVDDVLYSTKTPSETDPHIWPFDERFHFILNVAVGGNWPGNPDETTVFPQILEVDYVRVLDGNSHHVTGDRRVDHQETGVVYSVGNPHPNSSFTWSVPSGATIVSGQGTDSITVDWGTDGGDVTVNVASDCASEVLAVPVLVEPRYDYDFTFENFDDAANVTVKSATGTLVEVANPDPSGVNTSALSGEYTRNDAEQYDTLFYDTAMITDASQYSTEQKRFSMDLYTAAPAGTDVLIQLEDSSVATSSNYPSGRHSRYVATTTVQNAWERLTFTLIDQPDPSTADNGVDDIVILFAPNGFTGDVFTFDNFDSYIAAGTSGGTAPAAPSDLAATATSSSAIDLTWSDNSGDESGFEVERASGGSAFALVATVGADVTEWPDSGLAASTTYDYRVRAYNADGASAYSNTASATTAGSGGGATTVHVQSVVAGTENVGQGFKRGTATVTLADDQGNAVGSATVTGTFSGDFSETASGDTAGDGTVTLVTSGTKKGGVSFTFCVDDVSHGTLTYDPAANVQTCGSV